MFPLEENVSNWGRAWSKRVWSLTHLLFPHLSQAGAATGTFCQASLKGCEYKAIRSKILRVYREQGLF